MAKTVIGFFKNPSDVQKAVSQLEAKGISRQSIDVSQGEYKDATADLDGRNTNRVTDFFNKLFGHDSDDAKRYSTIGQSDVTIVTVHAQSDEQAETAADELDDCGAVDVDEHGRQSGFASYGGNAGNTAGSDISRQENSGTERELMGNIRSRSRIVDRSLNEDNRLRD